MVSFDFPRTLRDARPHTLSRISDGDTPVIDQPVHMVSVDTPEKAEYAGLPPTAQAKLDRCRQRLQDGTYTEPPRCPTHLPSRAAHPRLGRAAH